MKTGRIIFITSIIAVLFVACNQNNQTADKKQNSKDAEIVYDDNNNIIERRTTLYNIDSTIRGREEYFYKFDNDNNRIEEINFTYAPSGDLVSKTVNTYKYMNHLRVEGIFITYDGDNNETQWIKNVYKYNEQGFEIEEIQYNKAGFKTNTVIKIRNEKGMIFEEIYVSYHPDGTPKDTNGLKYNERGGVIKTYKK